MLRHLDVEAFDIPGEPMPTDEFFARLGRGEIPFEPFAMESQWGTTWFEVSGRIDLDAAAGRKVELVVDLGWLHHRGPGFQAEGLVYRAGSFMIAPKHGGDLYVSVEDYASNVTEPVRIPTADEMEDLSVDDPTQPDAARSLIEAVDGEAQADGEQTRSVKVSVRDSFGNPLPGVEVAFTLPEGIASALDGAAITVVTGSDGRATIAVTSQTAGEYVIDASVNGATIGDGATVTFSAVPGTSQDPDDDTDDADGDQQDGTHNQGTAGGGADQNATGPLSSTGSAIIAVIVVTVACVAAGAGIMLRRRRSS